MWEGSGSVPPELGVARRLIARGHSVTVIADPTIEREARIAGCAFTPWTTAPHATTRGRGGAIFPDYKYKTPLAGFKKWRDLFLCGPAHLYAADLMRVLAKEPHDAVVPCALLLGAVIGGEASRRPTIALMPNIYMFPATGMPPLGPGFMPARGPAGRLRDAVVRRVVTRLFDKGLPPVNAARSQLGLAPLAHLFDQYERIDAMLLLTAHAFDFPARLPSNVRYCGPILDDPVWAKSWQPPWPSDDTRPLVLVSFSSGYQAQEDVLRRTIAAVDALDVRAVVTTGEALDPGAFTASRRVHVVASAPHGDLMPQAHAIVTHCGHGTTMKALINGVPMVCIPMGRDQNDTAARVVARGAGIRLPVSATSDRIAAAIRTVLDVEAYRTSAKRLGAAIAAEMSQDVGATVEQIVAAAHERMAPDAGS